MPSLKGRLYETTTYPFSHALRTVTLRNGSQKREAAPKICRGDSNTSTLFKSHHFPTFVAYSVWYQPPETRHFFGPTQLHPLPIWWQDGISGQLCTGDRERMHLVRKPTAAPRSEKEDPN